MTPVVKIDGEQVGDGKVGPVTRQLQEALINILNLEVVNSLK